MKRKFNATSVCKNCGMVFGTYTWLINRGEGKYCSLKCLGENTLPLIPIKPAPNYHLRHMARKKAELYCKHQPCEICGDDHSEAHHDDYAKAQEVMWLCRKHHMQRHARNFTPGPWHQKGE